MNKRQKEVQQLILDNEKKVLRELEHNYQDALNEINIKIEMLLARQDADMQHVIYQVEHQKALKTQVQSILEQLQANEFEKLSEYLANSYTDGFVGTMYDIHGQGVPLILPMDQKQIVDAIQHDTKLSEKLYTSLGKDIKVLNKRIAGEISRGISTGQGYMEIARNISSYANISKNRAMTIARTESHRIQCKATSDAQHKAKEEGADILKQWDSALDGDTRKSHKKLDGQIRELDEPFEVDGHKAMHPGDFGRPEEDINCRCALVQRARWALDEDELDRLKDRAAYYGLDKSEDFKDFKKKYLKAAEKESVLDNVQKNNEKNSENIEKTEENGIIEVGNIRSFKEDDEDFKAWKKTYTSDNKDIGLTKTDKDVINYYGDDYFEAMNASQRFEKGSDAYIDVCNKFNVKNLDKFAKKSDQLEEALSKFQNKEPMIVYRSVSNVDFITGATSSVKDVKAMIGKTFTEKGFTSTSALESVADTFGVGKNAWKMKIELPSGVNGGFVQDYVPIANEYEFLLNRNTKFEIVGVEQNKVKKKKYEFGKMVTRTVTENTMILKVVI